MPDARPRSYPYGLLAASWTRIPAVRVSDPTGLSAARSMASPGRGIRLIYYGKRPRGCETGAGRLSRRVSGGICSPRHRAARPRGVHPPGERHTARVDLSLFSYLPAAVFRLWRRVRFSRVRFGAALYFTRIFSLF